VGTRDVYWDDSKSQPRANHDQIIWVYLKKRRFMYPKKGQLKKGVMWETQCHINLASIPPIKILILGMVYGIEFTTISDFPKPWKAKGTQFSVPKGCLFFGGLNQQNLSPEKPQG
jgi:hypothetical protein